MTTVSRCRTASYSTMAALTDALSYSANIAYLREVACIKVETLSVRQ